MGLPGDRVLLCLYINGEKKDLLLLRFPEQKALLSGVVLAAGLVYCCYDDESFSSTSIQLQGRLCLHRHRVAW